MLRGEIWFAEIFDGDRPVLILERDPVAERIGAVVVAALTRTVRGLVSELPLTVERDGVPSDCRFISTISIRFPDRPFVDDWSRCRQRELLNRAKFSVMQPGAEE